MGRWRKLGVIAGGGALPARLAAALHAKGEPFHLIRLIGSADEGTAGYSGDDCVIGEAGRILRILKEQQCDAAVFAGIVERPDFSTLKTDWRGVALLPRVVAAAARGDGALLNVLVDIVETEGVRVIGAEEALTDLAAPSGPLGKVAPGDDHWTDIRKAAAVIRSLGAFDVGQAAVVANGLVLAIEAAEGTDAMLARCASFALPVRGEAGVGVLVKRPKPGQELRVDLPTIGPKTIEGVAAAGLGGVAVEAGAALVIDRDETIARADDAGVFIYGFESAELRDD